MQNIEVIKLIEDFLLSGEKSNVDYKKENYKLGKSDNKAEIIKDFIAMANSLKSNLENNYIIVGYDEESREVVGFETEDQSNFQQYINSNVDPAIYFEYLEININIGKVGIFIIDRTNFSEQPFLLKKEISLRSKPKSIGTGFIRIGTSTEVMNKIHFDKIYENRYNRDRSNDLKFSLFKNNKLAIVLKNVSQQQLLINNYKIKILDYSNNKFINLPFTGIVNDSNLEIYNSRNNTMIINPNSDITIFDFSNEFQNDLLYDRSELNIELVLESPNFNMGPLSLKETIILNH